MAGKSNDVSLSFYLKYPFAPLGDRSYNVNKLIYGLHLNLKIEAEWL